MLEEKVLLHATLCFPVSDVRVLLGVKMKMKKIGAGCRNGWGGGIDFGETAIESIVRKITASGKVVRNFTSRIRCAQGLRERPRSRPSARFRKGGGG